MNVKLIFIALLLGGMAACATPPVQEMSDARQAVRSAKAWDAERYAPRSLSEAQRLLEQAQRSLETGDYFDARLLANQAREQAIRAREEARVAAPR